MTLSGDPLQFLNEQVLIATLLSPLQNSIYLKPRILLLYCLMPMHSLACRTAQPLLIGLYIVLGFRYFKKL